MTIFGLSHNQAKALVGVVSAFLVVAASIIGGNSPWVVPTQGLIAGIAGIISVAPDDAP